jgi:hypothetical protein
VKSTQLVAIAALAFAGTALAGCGTAANQTPTAVQARPPAGEKGRSWIYPDAAKGDLAYISDGESSSVNIYSFPQGKLVGELTGFNPPPSGLCSDSKGNVFVPEQVKSDILEFAHGATTPSATLSDANEAPVGCAVDPTTGTLAVANVTSSALQAGGVSLYANASGSPVVVSDPSMQLVYTCGYDNKGNLFADGLTTFPSGGGVFQFAELPSGETSFTNISLKKKIVIPGAVQWDGTYLTVGDAAAGIIYRTNGAPGKIESTIKLAGIKDDWQTWIQGKTIVVPQHYNLDTRFMTYPGGARISKPVKVGSAYGSTVSVAAN